MKLALLSDIHANIHALDACLAHATDRGAQQFAVLGDLVGYGADPAAVVNRVLGLVADGAWVVKGNHDAVALAPPAEIKNFGDATAAWTGAQLDAPQRKFLQNLPFTLQLENILLVHASVDCPELWRYVSDHRAAGASLAASSAWSDVRYVFGGHVHLQSLYCRGIGADLMKVVPTPGVAVPVHEHSHWLATIGSVGQPRDGNPRAMYAMLDTGTSHLTFHRVAYDHLSAAAAIRRAGLPTFFADRLEWGR